MESPYAGTDAFSLMWRGQDLPRYEFSARDVEEHSPSHTRLKFIQQIPAAGHLRIRAEALNLLRPGVPGTAS